MQHATVFLPSGNSGLPPGDDYLSPKHSLDTMPQAGPERDDLVPDMRTGPSSPFEAASQEQTIFIGHSDGSGVEKVGGSDDILPLVKGTTTRHSPSGRAGNAHLNKPTEGDSTGAIYGAFGRDNTLLEAAGPLLAMAKRLTLLAPGTEIAPVRDELIAKMESFERRCFHQGIPGNQMKNARYLLATHVDELVACSPWGMNNDWGSQSLLYHFHGETWGGRGFFWLMKQGLEHPEAHRQELELIFICLSLGFCGQYRKEEQGLRKLEKIRSMLYAHIRRIRREQSCQFWLSSDPLQHQAPRSPWWIVPLVLGGISSLASLGYWIASKMALKAQGEQLIQTLTQLSGAI